MKLMKIYEEIMGEVQFTTDVDEDSVTIIALREGSPKAR